MEVELILGCKTIFDKMEKCEMEMEGLKSSTNFNAINTTFFNRKSQHPKKKLALRSDIPPNPFADWLKSQNPGGLLELEDKKGPSDNGTTNGPIDKPGPSTYEAYNIPVTQSIAYSVGPIEASGYYVEPVCTYATYCAMYLPVPAIDGTYYVPISQPEKCNIIHTSASYAQFGVPYWTTEMPIQLEPSGYYGGQPIYVNGPMTLAGLSGFVPYYQY